MRRRPVTGRAQRIAVGVTEEPGGMVAVCWAAREAALRNRSLHLVYAQGGWPMSHLPIGVAAACPQPPPVEPAVDSALQTVAALEPDVDVTACVYPAGPVQLLLDQSRQAGMVVLGNQGGTVLDSMVGGTICGALATRAPCPVVAVDGRPAWPDAPVVVAITAAGTALPAIEFGFDMADRRGVPLILHQVASDLRQRRRVCEDIARLAGNRESCTRRHPDVAVDWHASYGDPMTELHKATAEAQLLIMGAPTHGPAMSLITRSATHELLRKPPCSMAVVPANWCPPTTPAHGIPHPRD